MFDCTIDLVQRFDSASLKLLKFYEKVNPLDDRNVPSFVCIDEFGNGQKEGLQSGEPVA